MFQQFFEMNVFCPQTRGPYYKYVISVQIKSKTYRTGHFYMALEAVIDRKDFRYLLCS